MSDGYQNSEGSMLFDPARQEAFRNKLATRKEKNQVNMRLSQFKTLIQRKDTGNIVSLEHEKMSNLPKELE